MTFKYDLNGGVKKGMESCSGDCTPWGVGDTAIYGYMGYIGMCRCEGYGFQAVYPRIGCINQSVWD